MKTLLRHTLGLPASGNCEEQPEIAGRAGGRHMMSELWRKIPKMVDAHPPQPLAFCLCGELERQWTSCLEGSDTGTADGLPQNMCQRSPSQASLMASRFLILDLTPYPPTHPTPPFSFPSPEYFFPRSPTVPKGMRL